MPTAAHGRRRVIVPTDKTASLPGSLPTKRGRQSWEKGASCPHPLRTLCPEGPWMKAYLRGRSYSTRGGPVLDQRVSERLFLTGGRTGRFDWPPTAGLGSDSGSPGSSGKLVATVGSGRLTHACHPEVSKGRHPQVSRWFSSRVLISWWVP